MRMRPGWSSLSAFSAAALVFVLVMVGTPASGVTKPEMQMQTPHAGGVSAPARAASVPSAPRTTSAAQAHPGNHECAKNPGADQVVMLVHGFTSGPGTWGADTRDYLAKSGEVCIETFDYHDRSSRWVTDDGIGPLLAARIKLWAKRSREGGGPGKVVIVAHSMGGLAVRCAVAPNCAQQTDVSKEIAALVTFGTPNTGTFLKSYGLSWLPNILGPASSGTCQFVELRDRLVEYTPLCETIAAFGTSEAGRAFTPGSGQLKALPSLTETSAFPVMAVAGRVPVYARVFGQTVQVASGGDYVVGEKSALAEARVVRDVGGAAVESGWLGSAGHTFQTSSEQFLKHARRTIEQVLVATSRQRHITIGDGGAFATPSGNIVCTMRVAEPEWDEPAQARCEVAEYTFAQPSKPCDEQIGLWNDGQFLLRADGSEAGLLCAGDTEWPAAALEQLGGGADYTAWFDPDRDLTVNADPGRSGGVPYAGLDYGSTMRAGPLLCEVSFGGVTCTDIESGHGMFVSRAAYRVW